MRAEDDGAADDGAADPSVRAPEGYPLALVSELETIDHMRLWVRPIRPEDADGLVVFHAGLSARSVYRRYFFSHPQLSPTEIERFTRVDYRDRLALVVEDHGNLIGVARYERQEGTTAAEVAFVVADEFQHHGIGTVLLKRLAEAAWTTGIRSFEAETLSENRAMLDVFLHSGFPVSTTASGGTVSVRFSIDPGGT
jgi:RimJ/RimL family protein N-acetyltransferase